MKRDGLYQRYCDVREALDECEGFVVDRWKDCDNALDNFRHMQDLLVEVRLRLDNLLGVDPRVITLGMDEFERELTNIKRNR